MIGRTAEIPTLDTALSAPCADVPDLAGDSVDDLIDAHVELIKRYSDCRQRHDAVVRAWAGLK